MSQHDHYLAVVAGENRFGWRMAIPMAFLVKYKSDSTILRFCWVEVIYDRGIDFPSIVVTLRDSKRNFIIRHYSLISSNISSTIAHIRFDKNNWLFDSVSPMGVDHMAVIFRSRQDRDRYRFKIFNVSTSSLVRTFDIVVPTNTVYIHTSLYTDGHQPILRVQQIGSPTNEMSEYVIPKQDYGPFVPVVHRKSFKSESLHWNTWNDDDRIDAIHSINSLNPIPHKILRSMTPSSYMLAQRMSSKVGFDVDPSHHGILRRWIKVPSLKFLATEALFRAIPTLDRQQLEKMVGFDIFHGISTKRDEDIETVDVEETVVG